MIHQRSQCTPLKSGKKSSISDERIAKMERLGFKWNYDSQFSLTIAWNDQFSEIMKFKQHWWHCDVPQKYSKNPNLGKWTRHQIRQYRRLNSGKKYSISDEKIAQVERLEFKWNYEKQLALDIAWDDNL